MSDQNKISKPMSLSSAEARLASLPPAPRQERVRASCYWRNTASAAAAVAGLSGTVCGLYAATDSRSAAPEKVVFGFADRFLEVMKMKDGVTDPIRYGKTSTLTHDPLVWREAGDHLLREADIKVLFHTTVVDVLNDGERVEGVVAWTKQGRIDIQAGVTIDASGDADVAALAGLETFVGRDGSVQNPTMIFRLVGVDVARFLTRYGEDSILGDEVSQMIRNLHNSREYDLPRAKVFMFPTPRPNELLCNCTRIIGRDGRELNPLWVEDITEAEIQGRRQAREYARSKITWSAARTPSSTTPASRSACARPAKSGASAY